MKQSYFIRPAEAADLLAVKRLVMDCDLPADGLDEQFGGTYCVAECEGEIIGAGGVEVYGAHGLLRSVAVLPARRGKSVGEALVNDRLAWAATQGLSEVYLLTLTAAKFFERCGFFPVTRDAVPPAIRKSSEFSSVCPASAKVMRCSLDSRIESAPR